MRITRRLAAAGSRTADAAAGERSAAAPRATTASRRNRGQPSWVLPGSRRREQPGARPVESALAPGASPLNPPATASPPALASSPPVGVGPAGHAGARRVAMNPRLVVRYPPPPGPQVFTSSLLRGPGPEAATVAAPRRVLVVSGSVGAGHDGAAGELARRLRARGVTVVVRDWLDAVPGPVRAVLRDGYAPTVRWAPGLFGWLFTSLEGRGPVRGLLDWLCRLAEPAVSGWAAGADAVVSTYPLASQTLGALRARGQVAVPVATFLTDTAAHATWVHPGVDHHWTVGAATARHGEHAYGMAMTPVGPLVAPRFARPISPTRRVTLRAQLGVGGDDPVVLMLCGSLGIGQVPEAVAAVLAHPRARVLVCCGRNTGLRTRLSGMSDRVVALGWREDVPELMGAADVLVHNAGGLSVTEAAVADLPAITYLPVPGHGRTNAAVLAAAGLAPWPATPAALAAAIDAHTSHPHRPRAASAPATPDASHLITTLLET